MEQVKRFIRDEQGLETVEYAIILGLIVVATIAIITSIGTKVKNAFQTANTGMNGM
jgi:Flp pilus assembly pilin Flp